MTADLIGVLHQSLDLSNPDNVMLWAACCLGFFGFLRAGEFTTNSSFDPSVDLTPADLQVDSSTNPQSFRVFIKCAKTDPFRRGSFIFLGRGTAPLCPVSALTSYLHLRGPGIGPLFIFQNGRPLSRALLSSFLQTPCRQLAFLESSQVTALELALLPRPPREAFLTTSSRPWVAGQVKLIFCMCAHRWTPSSQ